MSAHARPPATLSAVYRLARAHLADAGIDSAALDARLLVEDATGASTEDLVCRPAQPVDANAALRLEAALNRRLAGEPVHRILGWREFYGLKLRLSPATLEPRPDTETLVDAVLPYLRAITARKAQPRILDLGTGSGAIALALLDEVPEATATVTDMSAEALATAQANARALGLSDRLEAVQSDWFEHLAGRNDVIVSNPPYIATNDIAGLDVGVRGFDPLAALDGGPDGLEAYRSIAGGVADHLADGGIVGVEIGHGQKEDVTALFGAAGYEIERICADLAGIDRAILFKRRV